MQHFNKLFGTKITAQSSDAIIKQIQNIKELSTVKYITEIIVPTSADRLLGKSELLYIARGEVQAGIDLSQLKEDNIKIIEENNSIEITLPPAKILDKKIDINASRVYSYDRGWFNFDRGIAYKLQTKAQREALNKIVVAACDSEIINTANDNAKVYVEQLLINISSYETVEVKTQPSNVCL